MSPLRPCPCCGTPTDFHDDELERVSVGSAICLECGLKQAETAFILEVAIGEHPELFQDTDDEEDDD